MNDPLDLTPVVSGDISPLKDTLSTSQVLWKLIMEFKNSISGTGIESGKNQDFMFTFHDFILMVN